MSLSTTQKATVQKAKSNIEGAKTALEELRTELEKEGESPISNTSYVLSVCDAWLQGTVDGLESLTNT